MELLKSTSALAILCLFLASCAGTAKKTVNLSLGMTKLQVVDVLGTPDNVRVTDGIEDYIYSLNSGVSTGMGATCGAGAILTLGLIYFVDDCRTGNVEDYSMKFEMGKLTSYGKVGDFDGTKNPVVDINIKN